MLRISVYLIVVISVCMGSSGSAQEVEIGSVFYHGLERTKHSFLRKIATFQVPGLVDSVQIERDIQNFRRLPSIAYVRYELKAKKDSDGLELQYYFVENRSLLPNVAVWTSVRQTAFLVGVNEVNFLGSNKSISGFYQNNGYHTYNVNFVDPYLFSDKFGLAISFTDWTSEEPLFFEGGKQADYEFGNRSLEVLILYRPSFNHRTALGVNPFRESYDYIRGELDAAVPQQLELSKFLIKASYEYNGLNFFYQYVEGLQSVFQANYVTTQDKFLLLRNDLNYFKRVRSRGNFGGRLRLGIASNEVGPFAPFALDNNVNIRGVGNVIDRGTAMAVTNLEYRHNWIDDNMVAVQSNTFVDFGTWRKGGGELSDLVSLENARCNVGIGARIVFKRIFGATLRADYGWDVTGNGDHGLVFGLGQYF